MQKSRNEIVYYSPIVEGKRVNFSLYTSLTGLMIDTKHYLNDVLGFTTTSYYYDKRQDYIVVKGHYTKDALKNPKQMIVNTEKFFTKRTNQEILCRFGYVR